MAAIRLHIFVRLTVRVHLLHEVSIGLVEEVCLAAADPEQCRFLAEICGKLPVEIVIERSHLLLAHAYRSGEHT